MRIKRLLSWALIAGGLLLLADGVLTLLWKEPVSAVYASIEQNKLEGELRKLGQVQPTPAEKTVLARLPDPGLQQAFKARAMRRRAENGQPIGRLEAPSIGLSVIVVQGTEAGDLRKGPGHYPSTAFPGEGSTVAVAGHRTTYGAPFSRIDALESGDAITVELPYGTVEYRVTSHRIVDDNDLSVLESRDREELVLQACHPRFFSSQRYLVYARPVSMERRS
jgi:sortase A